MRLFSENVKPPYQDYYDKHYVASVRYEGDTMIIEDGKRDLNRAKGRTSFCYVKDIEKQESVRLELQDNQWVRV